MLLFYYFTDTVPPRITFCPNDITQNSPVPGGCTVVTFPEPTAVDESNGQLTVIQSHRSGDCFQTGSTTAISYVFLDPAGNRASCTFSVRIDVPGNIFYPAGDIENGEKSQTFKKRLTKKDYRRCLPQNFSVLQSIILNLNFFLKISKSIFLNRLWSSNDIFY